MKTIMSTLLVLVMAFASASICAGATGAGPACVSTPAYTHYVGVLRSPAEHTVP